MGVRMVYPGVWEFTPETDQDESAKLRTLVRLSRLPLETRLTKRLSNFEEVPGREEGLNAVMEFIRGEIQPPLLLLYGEVGRSKTHLAIAIGWCFLAQLRSVTYYQVVDLLDALRRGYRIQERMNPGDYSPESFDSITKFIKSCDLLILDDLGVHKETEWATERLDTVVNHRYEKALPTVITANTLEISERILDRCKEGGRIVMLQGESYRDIIQKRKASARKKERAGK